nr:HAMP domain-containing histidine kinase [Bacteriovorax sp. HI3]
MGKSHPLENLFNIWKNISISVKLYFVVGIMATLVIIELFTLHFAMGNLSAVRAFVGGEASWSKAQKNAVYRFQRFALTKDEADYRAFHEALKIPDGDRAARLELEKPNPNMEKVLAGFVQGRIHPDDVPSVVNMLKRFNRVSYIAKAVSAWKEGDALLVKLRNTVDEYYGLVLEGGTNQLRMQKCLDEVVHINNELTKIEEIFSSTLGEGSRWMERLIFMILVILVITVESIGLTLTFFTSKAISKGLSNLNDITTEFGRGNFERRLVVDSSDELGQLNQSVNRMGDLLQKSYSDLRLSHKDLELKVQERTAALEAIATQNSELYKEARTAVKMRDDFLSIASHELRTPLTALNLQIYLLEKSVSEEEGPMDKEQVKKLTARSMTLVKKLATLQGVLMDLAQIRVGKLEIKKEQADLAVLVNDCIAQLATQAIRSGSELVLERSEMTVGEMDPIRMSQVVTNLLTNAMKYGERKPVRVKVFKENSNAVVVVQDEGLGVPLEKQEQIFERFERASDDPGVSGLGLGLYISKQIVEAHNGKIFIESVIGKGSSFIMKFPLHQNV